MSNVTNPAGFWERGKFWSACDYPGTEKKFVQTGEIKFWVEMEGKGPPLILIHGGPGGNHCYFHPGLSSLAKGHRLIYYDLRGHYLSSDPKDPEDYGLLQDASDVEALRNALGLDKISIFGHSYGGIVALMYGLMYPESIRALIFCSAPVDITDEEGDKLIDSHPISKKMAQAKSEREWVKLYYKFYFHKPLDPETMHYQELNRRSYETEKSQKVLKGYEKDKVEPNWRRDISKVDKPMLFLCGRYDPLALPKRIEKVITKLKDAKLIIFEESGHDPFVDEPERFTQVVLGFTNRLSTKRVY